MPKRILLVGALSTDLELSTPLAFHAHMAANFGDEFTLVTAFLDRIVYTLSQDSFEAHDAVTGVSLRDFDCVYMRGPKLQKLGTQAFYLSRFCAINGIACINDYSLFYSGTKVAQTIVFQEEQAPFLKTLYAINKTDLVRRAAQTLGFPYILKTNVGSHGDSNYLVRTQEAADAILADEPDTDFLAQAYCPNDRDYRLLIMGKKHLIFERRGTDGSHLNNTSKGGEATRTDEALPPAIVKKAYDISKRLNLMVSGVDVMPHLETGEFYFLEINSQPQLYSGALLPEKMEYLRGFLHELVD
ncbi:MAG: hypothetical protein ABWX94_02660 [Candidatus Saccharimonadales bacterium]